MTDEWLHTWIGSSEADRITVAGRDLPAEIMGRMSLTELAYLLITRREATPGERRILDAVLVSLADHGLTPSALAARFTHTGAPEAVQASVAAGLLGAGSVFLGPAGDTAQFLAEALGERTDQLDDAELRLVAERAVAARRSAGQRVPGLGHPVHRDEDPRTPRLYELAEEEGLLGPHLRLLRAVADANEERVVNHEGTRNGVAEHTSRGASARARGSGIYPKGLVFASPRLTIWPVTGCAAAAARRAAFATRTRRGVPSVTPRRASASTGCGFRRRGPTCTLRSASEPPFRHGASMQRDAGSIVTIRAPSSAAIGGSTIGFDSSRATFHRSGRRCTAIFAAPGSGASRWRRVCFG